MLACLLNAPARAARCPRRPRRSKRSAGAARHATRRVALGTGLGLGLVLVCCRRLGAHAEIQTAWRVLGGARGAVASRRRGPPAPRPAAPAIRLIPIPCCCHSPDDFQEACAPPPPIVLLAASTRARALMRLLPLARARALLFAAPRVPTSVHTRLPLPFRRCTMPRPQASSKTTAAHPRRGAQAGRPCDAHRRALVRAIGSPVLSSRSCYSQAPPHLSLAIQRKQAPLAQRPQARCARAAAPPHPV